MICLFKLFIYLQGALKEDFQPQYYDYMLFTEIELRMQGKTAKHFQHF